MFTNAANFKKTTVAVGKIDSRLQGFLSFSVRILHCGLRALANRPLGL